MPADRRRGMSPAMGPAAVAPILNTHHQHPRLPVRDGNTAACAVANQRRAPAPIQRRPWVLRELENGSQTAEAISRPYASRRRRLRQNSQPLATHAEWITGSSRAAAHTCKAVAADANPNPGQASTPPVGSAAVPCGSGSVSSHRPHDATASPTSMLTQSALQRLSPTWRISFRALSSMKCPHLLRYSSRRRRALQ